MKTLALAFTISVTMIAAAPVRAQSADIDALVYACKIEPAACAEKISAFFSNSLLDPDALEGLFGVLAARLYEIALDTSGDSRAGILAALQRIAELMAPSHKGFSEKVASMASQLQEPKPGTGGADVNGLVFACKADPESCTGKIEAFFEGSGEGGDSLEGALDQVASRLFDLAQGSTPGARLRYMSALRKISQLMRTSNPGFANRVGDMVAQLEEIGNNPENPDQASRE